jgi:hypothetical protein
MVDAPPLAAVRDTAGARRCPSRTVILNILKYLHTSAHLCRRVCRTPAWLAFATLVTTRDDRAASSRVAWRWMAGSLAITPIGCVSRATRRRTFTPRRNHDAPGTRGIASGTKRDVERPRPARWKVSRTRGGREPSSSPSSPPPVSTR